MPKVLSADEFFGNEKAGTSSVVSADEFFGTVSEARTKIVSADEFFGEKPSPPSTSSAIVSALSGKSFDPTGFKEADAKALAATAEDKKPIIKSDPSVVVPFLTKKFFDPLEAAESVVSTMPISKIAPATKVPLTAATAMALEFESTPLDILLSLIPAKVIAKGTGAIAKEIAPYIPQKIKNIMMQEVDPRAIRDVPVGIDESPFLSGRGEAVFREEIKQPITPEVSPLARVQPKYPTEPLIRLGVSPVPRGEVVSPEILSKGPLPELPQRTQPIRMEKESGVSVRETAKKLPTAEDIAKERAKLIPEEPSTAKLEEAPIIPALPLVQPKTGLITKLRSLFRPEVSLPKEHKEAYLELRDKFHGYMNRVDNVIGKFFGDFIKWSPEKQKAADAALRGDDFDVRLFDTKERIALQNARELIDRAGYQATVMYKKTGGKYGLPPEVYERNKGKYLANYYLEHEVAPEAGMGLASKVRMDLSRFKSRVGLTPEEQAELGLIESAAYSGGKGTTTVLRDIGKLNYMRDLESKGLILRDPEIAVEGRRVLPSDLARQKKELKAKGFVQFPQSGNYGPFAGQYAPKAIVDDTAAILNVRYANINEGMKKALDINRAGVGLFKMAKVPLQPSTAVKNVVSNPFQLMFGGVSPAKLPFLLEETAEDMLRAAKGDVSVDYGQAVRHGLFGKSQSAEEVGRVLRDVRQLSHEAKGGSIIQVADKLSEIADYYGGIDDFFKYAMFRHQKSLGKSNAKAAQEANFWIMDYSLVSPSVRFVREQGIVPFPTYIGKMPEIAARALKERPHIVIASSAIPIAMTYAALEKDDISEEEYTNLVKQLPRDAYKGGEFALVPAKTKEGWRWLNVGQYVPTSGLLKMGRAVKEGEVGAAISEIGGRHPLQDVSEVIYSIKKGEVPVDPYSNIPIYDEIDTGATKIAKFVEWLWGKHVPNWMSRGGAGEMLLESVSGVRTRPIPLIPSERQKRPATTGEAAQKLFGVQEMSPEEAKASRLKEMLIERKKLKSSAYREAGKLSREGKPLDALRLKVKEKAKRIIREGEEPALSKLMRLKRRAVGGDE